MKPCIDIVLASYNGEQFIAEQLQSLRASTSYSQLVARVIVTDDGSSDRTCEIVRQFAIIDNKIELHSNPKNGRGLKLETAELCEPHCGPSANFANGISITTAPYIMLCDQDDVWHPHKILQSYDQIRKLENTLENQVWNERSCSVPVLVFTDKLIVDEQLNILSSSYFELKKIAKDWHCDLNNLLQQNVASGCTMLFNRALLNLAIPIPLAAYMHDWWLVLIAARCGEVSLIDEPLIKYRQHASNSIGARPEKRSDLLRHFFAKLKAFQQSFTAVLAQAEALNHFEVENRLSSTLTAELLTKVSIMTKQQRLKAWFNGSLKRSHIFGNLALALTLVLMPVASRKVRKQKGKSVASL